MIEVSRMVSGNTSGTSLGEKYRRNFMITSTSRSLPASSPMYSQIVWSTKMNMSMIKTEKNVFKKLVSMYRSSIFNLVYSVDVIIAVAIFVKGKQIFRQGLICLKAFYGNSYLGTIFLGLDKVIDMFGLFVYPQ